MHLLNLVAIRCQVSLTSGRCRQVARPLSFHTSLDHSDIMESTNRRRVRSPSPVYNLDDQDDSYEPYIPIAKRRQEKMAKLSSWGINAGKPKMKRQEEEEDEREDALKEEELRREKTRKERTLLIEAQEVHLQKAAQGLLRLSMAYHSIYATLRFQEIGRRKGTGGRC